MVLNLFKRFILWLKEIFHIILKSKHDKKKPSFKGILKIKSVEVTRQPDEISTKIVPIEVLPEENKIEILSGPNEKDILKKPYKKRPPTEKARKEPLTVKKKLPSPEQKKTIHLGDSQKRSQSSTGMKRKPVSNESVKKEPSNKGPGEKKLAAIVSSPYLEINLDDAEVYLILPKQQFTAFNGDKTPPQISYRIELNEKQQEVLVKVTNNKDGVMTLEEERILLNEPLRRLQVALSSEIQGKQYEYNHKDELFYAFVAIGNNRGRMYYLYDKDGNINALPKRDVWILLHNDLVLLNEPDVIEERWVWKNYQPSRNDLSKIDVLVIKNRKSGEEKSFSVQPTFYIEEEQLIEDDFKRECPLFVGKTIKIVAPYENQSGWNVWIQNKTGGYKIKENWTGGEPLTLRHPEDLPCEFGEFQLDICNKANRVPDATLFFRFVPGMELDYSKELIIPNPKFGHTSSTISVKLDSNDEWILKNRGNQKIEVNQEQRNFYKVELPPEEDTLRLSLAQKSRPEPIVNFQITLPRLRWKTSKQKTWNSRLQTIERKDLKSGESIFLLIQTNDYNNKYDLLALLVANGQKLQEGKFIRKGLEYSLELNQFFDTVKYNKDELTIRVEIRKIKEEQLVGSIDALYFEGEPKVPKKMSSQKPREKTTSRISNFRALVKCQGRAYKQRKAKGFSKRELICARIDLNEVRCLNIPYDKRRRSSHHWNIETLKILKEKYDNYGGR